HPDHLGSSSYISTINGRISQHIEYFPFGETLVEEHKNSNNSPYKFNGKMLDAETGNYYYGARYYNPKWSIWLSVDPLAEKYPGWSPYNYTLYNPVRFVDPDGRSVAMPDPDDVIYIADNRKVSRVIETDNEFNVFIMESSSQVLHLNDNENLDNPLFTNDNIKRGDRIFFPISDKKLTKTIENAGKGKWYN